MAPGYWSLLIFWSSMFFPLEEISMELTNGTGTSPRGFLPCSSVSFHFPFLASSPQENGNSPVLSFGFWEFTVYLVIKSSGTSFCFTLLKTPYLNQFGIGLKYVFVYFTSSQVCPTHSSNSIDVRWLFISCPKISCFCEW